MKKQSRSFWVGFTFTLLLAIYFLLFVPTFDLDESLYRRVAEEMKIRSDFWHPYWDARPMLHKPPILYWLINAFSSVIDSTPDQISAMASRLPGFLAAIAMTLALGLRRSQFLWLAAFPLLTACSVIFDPLQTLALLPVILIPQRWFRESRDGTFKEHTLIALGLALACAVKGLNGIIIPTAAVFIHFMLFGGPNIIKNIFSFLAKSFLPAAALSFAYYFILHAKMGPAFTNEFFWVQHFGRSQAAMESHGGGFWYYPLVAFIGLGALLPSLLGVLKFKTNSETAYGREGYWITFSLSFIVAFSFSATKLPHYLWPIWPALAAFTADRWQTMEDRSESPKFGALKLLFAFIPLALFSAAAVFLALNPIVMIHMFSKSVILKTVLPLDYAVPTISRMAFAIAAIIGIWMIAKRSAYAQDSSKTFAASSAFFFLFTVGLSPVLVNRIHQPIVDIAGEVRALNLPAGTCMWYSGPHSPTLSLALGHSILHNRCEPPDMELLIAPDWKVGECEERGMGRIAHHGYLTLCRKGATSTIPQNVYDGVKQAVIESQNAGTNAPAIDHAPGDSINHLPNYRGSNPETVTEDDHVTDEMKAEKIAAGVADPGKDANFGTAGTEEESAAQVKTQAKGRAATEQGSRNRNVQDHSIPTKESRVDHYPTNVLGSGGTLFDFTIGGSESNRVVQRQTKRAKNQNTAIYDETLDAAYVEPSENSNTPISNDPTLDVLVDSDTTGPAARANAPAIPRANKRSPIPTRVDTPESVTAPGFAKKRKGGTRAENTLNFDSENNRPMIPAANGATAGTISRTSSITAEREKNANANSGMKPTTIDFSGDLGGGANTEDKITAIENRKLKSRSGKANPAKTSLAVAAKATPARYMPSAGFSDDLEEIAENTTAAEKRSNKGGTQVAAAHAKPAETPKVVIQPPKVRVAIAPIKKSTNANKSLEVAAKRKLFADLSKTVRTQVITMDFCEAYMCPEQYRSDRIIDNIEVLLNDFPEAEYRSKHLAMLNDSLAKAIEYKKNWQDMTHYQEVGLMNQEQVDEAMVPIIKRLRSLISQVQR